MLRALCELKQRSGGEGSLYVAHFNHQLRAGVSDADQDWVERLGERLGLPVEVGKADAAASGGNPGDGSEAAARDARYEFLGCVAERVGARWVAVAHTADDQVETILHRLVRGTGLGGLAGMRRIRPLSSTVTLVRPLLDVRRAEVLQYLESIGQEFRTDVTNSDRQFTRNRLRHELLPALRTQYNAKIDDALLRLARQAAEVQQSVSARVEALAERCVELERTPRQRLPALGNGESGPGAACGLRIDCRPLASEPQHLVREICKAGWEMAQWPLQSMGFEEWQQLADIVHGTETVAIDLPGNVHARRRDGSLELRRPASTGLT